MKRVGKNILFVFILLVFISSFNVMAKEGKTLTIELPTNEVDGEKLFSSFTYSQYAGYSAIKEDDSGGIVNADGVRIINIHTNESVMYFELLDGFTEENCTIDITSEMLENLRDSLKLALEGYSKIKIELKKLDLELVGDTFIVNLDGESIYDNPLIAMEICTILGISSYDNNINHTFKFYNLNNKELGTLTAQENSSGTFENYRFTLAKGVTSDDDIIIQLTEDEKSNIINYLNDNADFDNSFFDNYSRLVIKFSDKSYLDSDYVIDVNTMFSNITESNLETDPNNIIIDYIVDENLLLVGECYYLLDTNNKKVAEMFLLIVMLMHLLIMV